MADEPENEALTPAEAGVADADSPTAEVVAEASADEAAPAEAPAAKPKRTRAKPKAEAPAEEAVAAEPVAEEPVAEEPVAEATAEAETAPEPEAEPVAEAAPAAKPKRAPAKKPAAKKPAAKKAAPKKERGTYVRTPAGEPDPGIRKERRGLVVSSAEDKTITVRVDVMMAHPKYKKIMRRSVKLRAHDEANSANVGDVVRVVECRPLSKTKRWRLVEVLEVAK
ncbi:MAG: small subunit ribosomal protein [Gaiellaceae bacterium]|nr:small subunit ribosomal protein [Gaiellaceae bacterium]